MDQNFRSDLLKKKESRLFNHDEFFNAVSISQVLQNRTIILVFSTPMFTVREFTLARYVSVRVVLLLTTAKFVVMRSGRSQESYTAKKNSTIVFFVIETVHETASRGTFSVS